MMPDEVISYFGGWTKASRFLNMGSSTYHAWKVKGFIPIRSQHIIEKKINGDLKADVRHDLELFND
jgi:hypothetical protein